MEINIIKNNFIAWLEKKEPHSIIGVREKLGKDAISCWLGEIYDCQVHVLWNETIFIKEKEKSTTYFPTPEWVKSFLDEESLRPSRYNITKEWALKTLKKIKG